MVDFMILLYESTDLEFTTNGLGSLGDAISCVVTEELNGKFELEMEYPIIGIHYVDIIPRRIIRTKSNPYSDPQLFRIYSISKPLNGVITVNAEHISYDLSGYIINPFIASSLSDALYKMEQLQIVSHSFTFYTDMVAEGFIENSRPSSIRAILGGRDMSLLERYGGEYEFDNFSVRLLASRGTNRGFSILYGKNLIDIRQEENCSTVYTGVYPFWYSDETGLVSRTEKIVPADGIYDFVRIWPLDLSSEFENTPSDTELFNSAIKYMQDTKIGIPKVSISVSFVPLSQTEEYKSYALLETVLLGDTVNVEFSNLNVNATAKCIETVYNVITDKYINIELGDIVSNLASTVSSQAQIIKELPEQVKNKMDQAVENATKLITGNFGGNVVLHSSTGGTMPDEILIMDEPEITTAQKVWRWNMGGLGYSKTGYNGDFALAMTMDGAIVADFITVGELDGVIVKTGSIKANAISQEYTSSITDTIYGMTTTLRQEFEAADGVLSSRITTTEGSISSIDQYVDSLTLGVINSSVSSTIQLKAGSVVISSKDIAFSGMVTFNSLSTSGASVINGNNITTGFISANIIETGKFATIQDLASGITIIDGGCITTGKISANFIGPNNGNYISFTSPVQLSGSYPDMFGIDTLYFSTFNYITDNGYSDNSHGLTLYSSKHVSVSATDGLLCTKFRSEGNMSIDAYTNLGTDYTIYIGTATISAGGYEINQKVQIGNSNGTSTINLYGTLRHNGYILLNEQNLSSYIVFQ